MPCLPLDAEQLRSTLEAAGWRCTRQRLAVYEYLAHADGQHPTAEEIYQGVREAVPNISLATVYKALEAFEACGLATRLAAGDGSARFDARNEGHYHLRCLRSGRVQDLPTP
ncbi:MAG: transcriptional repressor, partial [Isosphaeraceae bacterium]|nr:transcriptional repressor [Isosphaeraceae bacterium]